MPATATITAFYNFTAGTKAKSSEMNNNFDVFRGHCIAVDPTLNGSNAVLLDNSYDLGSTEYRWRNAYTAKCTYGRSASGISIEEDTSLTTTAATLLVKVNSTSVAKFGNSGYYFVNSSTSEAVTLTALNCNGHNMFTNDGIATTSTYTLPTPADGLSVVIANAEAKTLTVQRNTTTVSIFATITGATSTVHLSNKGDVGTFYAINALEWVMTR